MSSKSWTPKSTVQWWASVAQRSCRTDPIIYTEKDCNSDQKNISKRKSEESLERASKRSRTSQSPCEGCSRDLTGPTTSTVSGETPSSSGPSHGAVLGSGKTSSKRKSNDDIPDDNVPSTSANISSRKRKSEETEGPRKRSRKTHYLSEASSDNPDTSSSANTVHRRSRDAFESKYEEGKLLGEGGFGAVFAGFRKKDNLPLLDGENSMVPLEVALLLKVKPPAAETSAIVTLLDWYDLDRDLILVLERPVPCCDLYDYVESRGSSLQEHEAKTIAKQLVDAVIEIHSRGVFHRDIKLENILLETGSDVPRVRLIDFGCGTFLSEENYISGPGTYVYVSPEWFTKKMYRAVPATVWQLGVVLFEILHGTVPFTDSTEIVYVNPDISESLSIDCQGFLRSCLTKTPEARPTLETLKDHPWLK
uniref:serine/threonine-protein kinase pim-2-like n=1 Tax=Semicossyphus pulcher TaxID=241346 RepID=UPI0037E7197B